MVREVIEKTGAKKNNVSEFQLTRYLLDQNNYYLKQSMRK